MKKIGYNDWLSDSVIEYIKHFDGTDRLWDFHYYSSYSIHICDVIFNDPATIVFWSDGTKTVVKCGKNDTFDKEKGLAMAIVKRITGNKGRFNEIFKKWVTEG